MRIVICSRWNDSAFPLFKKINVLSILFLFQYETAKHVHRHSSKNLLVNLSNYFILSKNIYSTRFTTNENLQTPLFRLQRTQKSIKFTGAKIWNSIQSNIRKSSFRNFKKMFKTYLLYSSDLYSSVILHSINQSCDSFNFFCLLKRSECALSCMVSVALADNGNIVSVYNS